MLNIRTCRRSGLTVLLGVHRGGRAKLKSLRQISEAIAEQLDRADRLMPVLAVAIRSVLAARGPCGTHCDSLGRFGQARAGSDARAVHPRTTADFDGGAIVRVSFAYLGRSQMLESSAGERADHVDFTQSRTGESQFRRPALLHPLRFREAIIPPFTMW